MHTLSVYLRFKTTETLSKFLNVGVGRYGNTDNIRKKEKISLHQSFEHGIMA